MAQDRQAENGNSNSNQTPQQTAPTEWVGTGFPPAAIHCGSD